jgi:hypothetical protein
VTPTIATLHTSVASMLDLVAFMGVLLLELAEYVFGG